MALVLEVVFKDGRVMTIYPSSLGEVESVKSQFAGRNKTLVVHTLEGENTSFLASEVRALNPKYVESPREIELPRDQYQKSEKPEKNREPEELSAGV